MMLVCCPARLRRCAPLMARQVPCSRQMLDTGVGVPGLQVSIKAQVIFDACWRRCEETYGDVSTFRGHWQPLCPTGCSSSMPSSPEPRPVGFLATCSGCYSHSVRLLALHERLCLRRAEVAEPRGDRVAERRAGLRQGHQHALHPGEPGPVAGGHHVRRCARCCPKSPPMCPRARPLENHDAASLTKQVPSPRSRNGRCCKVKPACTVPCSAVTAECTQHGVS